MTLSIFLVLTSSANAVTIGQVDDFQNASTSGWDGAAPLIASKSFDPADLFLQATSDGGGRDGKLVVHNRVQWQGDYLAAGITAIEAAAVNLGSVDLELRLSVRGPAGVFASATGIPLPADGVWRSVRLSLEVGALFALSGTSLDAVLADVDELRIMHSTFPACCSSSGGDPSPPSLRAQFGLDDITAAPEPSATGLLALALAVLGVSRLLRPAARARAAAPRGRSAS